MSKVTNVILKTGCNDCGIHQLNEVFFKEMGPRHGDLPFVSCDDDLLPHGWYAGTKMLECEIYPASFNYLDVEALVEAIRKSAWEFPESVQLFIQEEHSDRMKEIPLGDLRLQE
jgi:hypothetical protein